MKKSCAVLVMMLSLGNILESSATNGISSRELFFRNLVKKDGIESLNASPWVKSVSVTPTNLVLEISPSRSLWTWNGDDTKDDRLTEYGEELLLTPDKKTTLSDGRHVDVIFTPATFQNQMKGFQILHKIDDRMGGYITTCLGYVALSDKPTEVHKNDVEMIMENGEWKKYEKLQPVPKAENDVQYTQSSRENPVTVAQDETPVNTAEDESSEEKGKATTFWHYALIPLCLLAVLWVVKRKRNRNSP